MLTKVLIYFPPAQCNLHSGYALLPIALGRGAETPVDHFSSSIEPKVDHFFPGVGGSVFSQRVDHIFLDDRIKVSGIQILKLLIHSYTP